MRPGTHTTRRFEPTAEESSFLHALEVLFAPKPARPSGRKERGRLTLIA